MTIQANQKLLQMDAKCSQLPQPSPVNDFQASLQYAGTMRKASSQYAGTMRIKQPYSKTLILQILQYF